MPDATRARSKTVPFHAAPCLAPPCLTMPVQTGPRIAMQGHYITCGLILQRQDMRIAPYAYW